MLIEDASARPPHPEEDGPAGGVLEGDCWNLCSDFMRKRSDDNPRFFEVEKGNFCNFLGFQRLAFLRLSETDAEEIYENLYF